MTIPKLESIPNPIVINSKSKGNQFQILLLEFPPSNFHLGKLGRGLCLSWKSWCLHTSIDHHSGDNDDHHQSSIIFDVSVGPFLDLVQVCFNLSQNYFEVTFNSLSKVSFFRNWIEENGA